MIFFEANMFIYFAGVKADMVFYFVGAFAGL